MEKSKVAGEINKLNLEERQQIRKIVESGADIEFLFLKKIGGYHCVHGLVLRLNGAFPKDIYFKFLDNLRVYGGRFGDNVYEGYLKNTEFYFPRLKKLIFRFMSLSDLYFLGKHRHIQDLQINYCNLTSLPSFGTFDSLQSLNLSHNNLTSLKGFEELCNCSNLKIIYLDDNQIDDLLRFKSISRIAQLEEIHLDNNQLIQLNITHTVPNLDFISLNNNKIEAVNGVQNLPALKCLGLSNNKIDFLDFGCFKNVPCLKDISLDENPIKRILGLDSMPASLVIEGLPDQPSEPLANYIETIGWSYVDGYILKPPPKLEFKINKYLTLRTTVDDEIILYVINKDHEEEMFNHCAIVIIEIPKDKLHTYESITSIDEMVDKDYLEPGTGYRKIPVETKFWAHASNLQAWVENNYDTRVLHRNIAFPLLKKLTKVGDPLARKVFKEEIAKRYASGHPSVVKFLRKEGYLDYLDENELSSLVSN